MRRKGIWDGSRPEEYARPDLWWQIEAWIHNVTCYGLWLVCLIDGMRDGTESSFGESRADGEVDWKQAASDCQCWALIIN
jgi:hypothetical protein